MIFPGQFPQGHEAKFNRIVLRVVLVPIAVMVVAAMVLAWLVGHLFSVTNWQDHTDKVIAQAQGCESEMLDMQTALRGYLLTGDKQFLEAFLRLGSEIPSTLDALGQEVADNPPQVTRVSQIRAGFGRWARSAGELVEQRQHSKNYESIEAIAGEMALIKGLRDEISTFLGVENKLLHERSARVQNLQERIRRSRWFVLLTLGLGVGLYVRSQLRAVAQLYDVALRTTEQKSEQLQISEASLRHAQEKLQNYAEDLEKTVATRTAQLRETVSELESYSYSVSHDLRAPLRAVRNYALVLLQDCGEQLDQGAKVYLNRIMASCDRMDNLIQDVLTYSKINRTEIKTEPVDLEKLIHELIQQYPTLLKANGSINVETPLPHVNASDTLLSQAIANLLTNAVKFMPEGDQPRVRLRVETKDKDVRIWVEDNGIGIAPEYQKRIFGVFERIPGEKSYEGTGIGLAIVRRATERMGGKVGVVSELGRGSRFWIDLPGRKL